MQKLNTAILVLLVMAVAYLFATRPKTEIVTPTDVSETITEQSTDSSEMNHSGKIAYINVDSLNQNYKFLEDKKEQLKQEEANLDRKLRNKMTNAQKRYEELNQAAYTMTESQMVAAQQELEKLQEDIQRYQEQLTSDLYSLEASLQNELNTRISNFLETYNETQDYDYILGYQMGGQVLFGKEALNITEVVVNGLNAEYEKETATTAK